jgi:hypothetical protein
MAKAAPAAKAPVKSAAKAAPKVKSKPAPKDKAKPAPAPAIAVAAKAAAPTPRREAQPKPAPVKQAPAKPVSVKPRVPALPFPAFEPLAAPEFGLRLFESMTAQMMGLRRTFGEMQALLLDHACNEVKAGLSEIEKAARSQAPSEALVIGAASFRRSADHLANTVKSVTETAQKSFTLR